MTNTTTKLGEIKGNRESTALVTALANLQGVKAFRMAHGNHDTEFTYGIYLETKVRAAKLDQLACFVEGFKAATQIYR